jgi:hypothetical protein
MTGLRFYLVHSIIFVSDQQWFQYKSCSGHNIYSSLWSGAAVGLFDKNQYCVSGFGIQDPVPF